MSYDNTNCPCGVKKLPGTMLCDDCESEFASCWEMRVLDDSSLPPASRRQAALILLSRARRRKCTTRGEASTG